MSEWSALMNATIPRRYANLSFHQNQFKRKSKQSKEKKRKVRALPLGNKWLPTLFIAFHTCEIGVYSLHKSESFIIFSKIYLAFCFSFVELIQGNCEHARTHQHRTLQSHQPLVELSSTKDKLMRSEFEKEKWRNPIHLIKLSVLLFEENERFVRELGSFGVRTPHHATQHLYAHEWWL